MKITKTNKCRVALDNPWLTRGDVFERSHLLDNLGIDANLYPQIFIDLYELEIDGSLVCIGDRVWRNKNGQIKSCAFQQVHVSQGTPVFSTQKACEDWLSTLAKKSKAAMSKAIGETSFQKMKSVVNRLDGDFEDMSPKMARMHIDEIKSCIVKIEKLGV